MPVIDAHSHIYPDKIACKASSAVGDVYGVALKAGCPSSFIRATTATITRIRAA